MIKDIEAYLRKHVPPPRPEAQNHNGGPPADFNPLIDDREFLYDRARKYMSNVDPAVSGSAFGGHNQAYVAACILIHGYGFSVDEAMPIYLNWNTLNLPPFNYKDCKHKLEQAAKNPDREGKPIGYIRDKEIEEHRMALVDGQPDRNHPNYVPLGDKRIWIEANLDEMIVTRQAMDALARNDNIYKRSNILHEIVCGKHNDGKRSTHPGDSPRIQMVHHDKLRVIFSDCAIFFKSSYDNDKKQFKRTRIVIPHAISLAVHNFQNYEPMRPIEGVVEIPVIRPDGTILSTPGYDEQTSLVYYPSIDCGELPENPSPHQCREAFNHLMELVSEFPFDKNCHRGSWLATALSVICRHAFNGPCPVFLFDASTAGTGKTMLCDLISLILTGRENPRTTFSDDDEMRKRITSLLLDGFLMVLIDNVSSDFLFGGQVMDAIFTGTLWTDRLLSLSKSVTLKISSVFMVTGNNLAITGDLGRRLIPCRLWANVEEPEKRTFRVKNIKEFVLKHRAAYLKDLLTIARGFYAAGAPEFQGSQFGSFDGWSQVVRSMVIWAAGSADYDPVIGQGLFKRDDIMANRNQAIVDGFLKLKASYPDSFAYGGTVREIIDSIDADKDAHQGLRDVFLSWSRTRELPSANTIGMKLRAIRGKVIGNHYLTSESSRGRMVWDIREVGSEAERETLSEDDGEESVPF